MMKKAILFLVLALVNAEIFRKNLAGPPSEFSQNLLPTPDMVTLEEKSAVLEIFFEENPQNPQELIWTQALPVDSEISFTINVLSPLEPSFVYTLLDPSGNQIDLSNYIQDGTILWGDAKFQGSLFLFQKFPVGIYQFTVTCPVQAKTSISDNADALLILYNDSPVKIQTHLNTYQLHLGMEIGLVTRLTQDGITALKQTVLSAVMIVRDPSGKEEELPMHDDGLHGDGLADDGIYGALLVAKETGTFQAEALLLGKDDAGKTLLRSSSHLVPVVKEKVHVAHKAFAQDKDQDILGIHVPTPTKESDEHFRAYAEVWGKDGSGNDIPVAWIGGLSKVERVHHRKVISMELNKNWLSAAGVSGPLILKNFVLQCSKTFVPLTENLEIPVAMTENLKYAKVEAIEITEEMTQGKRPKEFSQWINSTQSTLVPNLLLVHGYCSSSNPWPTNQFTNGAWFNQPSVSVSNDNFAQSLIAYANNRGMTRFGAIAHSQGGMALAHLSNYYWSGLDNSREGKIIQSVGTPYGGNSLAGNTAALGAIFGVGCGSNFDLSNDGAALWGPGIGSYARSRISYYTATYRLGLVFGDWCSLPANAILDYPNDGVTELGKAGFSGATNMGNKEAWCHVGGMAYPAETSDSSRNSAMNNAAAR